MSSFSSCPKCAKPITIPREAEPADMVRCPLCASEYMLAEALANAPPELLVLRSLGVISREAARSARRLAPAPPTYTCSIMPRPTFRTARSSTCRTLRKLPTTIWLRSSTRTTKICLPASTCPTRSWPPSSTWTTKSRSPSSIWTTKTPCRGARPFAMPDRIGPNRSTRQIKTPKSNSLAPDSPAEGSFDFDSPTMAFDMAATTNRRRFAAGR